MGSGFSKKKKVTMANASTQSDFPEQKSANDSSFSSVGTDKKPTENAPQTPPEPTEPILPPPDPSPEPPLARSPSPPIPTTEPEPPPNQPDPDPEPLPPPILDEPLSLHLTEEPLAPPESNAEATLDLVDPSTVLLPPSPTPSPPPLEEPITPTIHKEEESAPPPSELTLVWEDRLSWDCAGGGLVVIQQKRKRDQSAAVAKARVNSTNRHTVSSLSMSLLPPRSPSPSSSSHCATGSTTGTGGRTPKQQMGQHARQQQHQHSSGMLPPLASPSSAASTISVASTESDGRCWLVLNTPTDAPTALDAASYFDCATPNTSRTLLDDLLLDRPTMRPQSAKTATKPKLPRLATTPPQAADRGLSLSPWSVNESVAVSPSASSSGSALRAVRERAAAANQQKRLLPPPPLHRLHHQRPASAMSTRSEPKQMSKAAQQRPVRPSSATPSHRTQQPSQPPRPVARPTPISTKRPPTASPDPPPPLPPPPPPAVIEQGPRNQFQRRPQYTTTTAVAHSKRPSSTPVATSPPPTLSRQDSLLSAWLADSPTSAHDRSIVPTAENSSDTPSPTNSTSTITMARKGSAIKKKPLEVPPPSPPSAVPVIANSALKPAPFEYVPTQDDVLELEEERIFGTKRDSVGKHKAALFKAVLGGRRTPSPERSSGGEGNKEERESMPTVDKPNEGGGADHQPLPQTGSDDATTTTHQDRD